MAMLMNSHCMSLRFIPEMAASDSRCLQWSDTHKLCIVCEHCACAIYVDVSGWEVKMSVRAYMHAYGYIYAVCGRDSVHGRSSLRACRWKCDQI